MKITAVVTKREAPLTDPDEGRPANRVTTASGKAEIALLGGPFAPWGVAVRAAEARRVEVVPLHAIGQLEVELEDGEELEVVDMGLFVRLDDPRPSQDAVRPVASVSGPPEAFGLPPMSAPGEERAPLTVTDVDRESGTITLSALAPASPPPQPTGKKRRRRGR